MEEEEVEKMMTAIRCRFAHLLRRWQPLNLVRRRCRSWRDGDEKEKEEEEEEKEDDDGHEEVVMLG